MKKPRVGIFDFACCEGCQLQIANMGEEVLDVLGSIEVMEWREVMSEKWGKKLDIAIIEGSITDPHAVKRIKQIRKKGKDPDYHRLLRDNRRRERHEEQFRARRYQEICVWRETTGFSRQK